MLKAYRYRIYPTKQQDVQMRSHIWLSKQLWNEMLAHTKTMYNEYGHFAAKQSLREMVKRQGLYSQVAQELVDRLLGAVDRYFRLKALGIDAGFPRFKSFHRMKSLCYPQSGFSLEGKKLNVSPFGSINVKLHRAVEGRIKTLSLKLEASGKWFAVFVTEQPLKTFVPNNGSPVGLDLGLKSFAVLSDGTKIANPRHLKQHERRLSRLQRRLSKKHKWSRNWFKSKQILAVAHEKVANTRRDFHHKLSFSFVHKYSMIAVEDLQLKQLIDMPDQHLNKSIHDAGWSSFVMKLCNKVEEAGCRVVKIEPRGTTQECSSCGRIVPKTLKDRIHNCPCELSIDRDLNASINILNRATVGHTESHACGVNLTQERLTMKQEAHTL